jgi:hypothetical protein
MHLLPEDEREEGCSIGNTDENGSLTTKFPLCIGGLLAIRHQDYYTPTLYLSTLFNRTVDFPVVEVYPYEQKEVNVTKHVLIRGEVATEKINISQGVALGDADEVFVLFTKVNDFEGAREHVAVAQIEKNTTSTLNLVPGTYKVSLDLLYHELIVVPEDEREEGDWPFQEEYTIPEVRFDDNYPKGGAMFDKDTGYVVITPEDLYSNKTLTLYVMDAGIPTIIEQINSPERVRALSNKHRGILEPKFI